MSIYYKNEISSIFWANNEGFKGGRDPMGIENSSIATYGCLLPGLTNLTKRIRYYSFYCWLIDEYNSAGATKYKTHQRNFIRRAELSIAFIMHELGENSIVGSQFISGDSFREIRPGVYNIAEGADYRKEKTAESYWTFPQGALGQYYAGSLIALRLIRFEDGWFYDRSKGKELAQAFRESVDENVRSRFLSCVESGYIHGADRPTLAQLSVAKIKRDSSEWNLLNHIIISPDENGSTLRQESIYLFLRAIAAGIDISKFPEYEFTKNKDANPNSAAFGWSFYYLCEALHYSIETIFWLVLEKAEKKDMSPLPVFLKECESAIKENLKDCELSYSVEENLIINTQDIPALLIDLQGSVKNNEVEKAASQAIWLICRIYNETEPIIDQIIKFERANSLDRQFGILSSVMYLYIQKNLSVRFDQFIGKVIRQVMNDHTMSACRKMGNNLSDLRKFFIEDGCIFFVEKRLPVFTNPRTNSLFNFLKDLGYIGNDNKITDVAKTFFVDYDKQRSSNI